MMERLKTLILLCILISEMLLTNARPANQTRQPDGDLAAGNWTTAPLWPKLNGVVITCPNMQTQLPR